MEATLKGGGTAEEFWGMTPRETAMMCDAATWRMERERWRDGALAWHVAALQRRKRLPSLRAILREPAGQHLGPEEMERRRREHEELVRRMGRKGEG